MTNNTAKPVTLTSKSGAETYVVNPRETRHVDDLLISGEKLPEGVKIVPYHGHEDPRQGATAKR